MTAHTDSAPIGSNSSAGQRKRVSRRGFIGVAAAGGAAAVGAAALASPRMAFATPSNPAAGDAVVVVFLRGGADGLSLTPPLLPTAPTSVFNA